MAHDELVKGKTILSCGHEDEHGCMGVSVQFDDEQCVAGEGFVLTTVHAQYCHECATKLYYEIGKDAGRVEAEMAIVAWLRVISDHGATFQDRRLAYQLAASQFADAIQAGEHHERG